MSEIEILAKIAGDEVAKGSNALPNPETADDREYDVEMDARYAGRVRIFYKRQIAKKGKHSHYYWLVYRAERIEA